jgi:hypothetical protein
MPKWLPGALLGIAIAGAAWAQGSPRFDGQYVGELALTGIVQGDCTEPPLGARYPLTISGGQVRFKYVPRFDTTLVGTVDATGNFRATRTLHRGRVSMTGHIDANHNLTAEITSPSCRYSFRTND